MSKRLIAFFAAAALLLSACGQQAKEVGGTLSEQEGSSSAQLQHSMNQSQPDFFEQESNSEESQSAQENSSAQPPLTTRFTVPEGYTLAKIGLMLEENQILTAQEWMQTASSGDFSEFSLVEAQTPNENICFKLEGYLFPDTYEIYTEEDADAILRRMLSHTERVITSEMRAQIQQSGFTVHEILTLASIIEKEAFGPQEMKNISSVLHNRLKANMRFQCDVTIKYVEGAIKPFITGDLDRYNEYYNTYKCDALPAGPICNPSLAAIQAAISPSDTPYYFFLTDSQQNYLYAETYEEHKENKRQAGI